ncbi:MAG: hypothetical protein Q4D98_07150 [Planctomycetia bacterium]|nr:hypothetical protein [Planctomycetia bacterium]
MAFDFGQDDRSFLENYDDVQAAGAVEQLPPGTYEALLSGWRGSKSNRKQTPYILLTFTVSEGEYRGAKIFYRLYWTESSAPYSRGTCEKLGIDPRKTPEDYGKIQCSVTTFLRDEKYVEVDSIANIRHGEKQEGGSPFDV